MTTPQTKYTTSHTVKMLKKSQDEAFHFYSIFFLFYKIIKIKSQP